MKASALRIGNLVNYTNGGIFKVIGIHDFGLDVEDEIEITYMELENFEPIPLTEEWLVKFGFEKGTLIYKNDSFNFNGEIVFKGEDSFRYFGTNAKLKYVHQLQNLYFALTAEELKIKP